LSGPLAWGDWSARDKGMLLRAQAVPRPKLSKGTEKPAREQRHSKDNEKPDKEQRHSKSSTKTLRVKPDKAEIERHGKFRKKAKKLWHVALARAQTQSKGPSAAKESPEVGGQRNETEERSDRNQAEEQRC
jgi:hypothetical protein